jgi:phenylacetic acid degradation operon negative regulatory protein
MVKRPKVQTQFIIFNLFGDYVNPRGDSAWTSGLLDVLEVLGVSERAARSTLSRMKQKGWLHASKDGRRSAYQLTPRGKQLLDEGGRRLFGPRPGPWDGRWHLVTYSLPQAMRTERGHLRTGLSWLGYGMLSPGTMVAAYPMSGEVCSLLKELDVESYVDFFTESRLEMKSDAEIVTRCWDLPDLNRRYVQFIDRHRAAFESLISNDVARDTLPHSESFVHRFWATYEFSAFPREDPRLPAKLLPEDWRGKEAAELMTELRSTLKQPAEQYIDTTLGIHIRQNRSRSKAAHARTPGTT